MAMHETLRLAMKSAMGDHDCPPLTDFHTPPATAPSQMTWGLVGWTMIERVRPPTFPGPSHFQPARVIPPGMPGDGGVAPPGIADGPIGIGAWSRCNSPAVSPCGAGAPAPAPAPAPPAAGAGAAA